MAESSSLSRWEGNERDIPLGITVRLRAACNSAAEGRRRGGGGVTSEICKHKNMKWTHKHIIHTYLSANEVFSIPCL